MGHTGEHMACVTGVWVHDDMTAGTGGHVLRCDSAGASLHTWHRLCWHACECSRLWGCDSKSVCECAHMCTSALGRVRGSLCVAQGHVSVHVGAHTSSTHIVAPGCASRCFPQCEGTGVSQGATMGDCGAWRGAQAWPTGRPDQTPHGHWQRDPQVECFCSSSCSSPQQFSPSHAPSH